MKGPAPLNKRASLYGLAALGCLATAGLALVLRSPGPEPSADPKPRRPSVAALDPDAVSAPAPEPGPPPDSRETAKALQAILAGHPVVQARERKLAGKAAQGDALIPDLVRACIDHPEDDVLVVDAVEILKRIDTEKARRTLAALRQENPIAAIACSGEAP